MDILCYCLIYFIDCLYQLHESFNSEVNFKSTGNRDQESIGARRKEIIIQFLSESVLISWIALLFAFGLTWLVLPWLNTLTGQQL